MKFIVDQPLAGLAKWLRFCGFDAVVQRLAPGAPPELPRPQPGVCLVTRQQSFRSLPREDLLILAANDPEGQLQEVIRALKLTRDQLHPLSRCGRCNLPLVPLPREQALGLVPEHIFHTQEEFRQCPGCGQVYWPGSHHRRILDRLEEPVD